VTGTADPGGIGRLRPGPLARISHDPDALEAFYTEHVTAVTRFVARLLAELRQVVAERAAAGALPAAETHSAVPGPSAPNPAAPNPAARRQAGPGRPHRRLAITGAVSAAGAASLAVVLTVTLSGSGGQLADPAAPRFVAATTVAAVLNNAALAAQREPAVPPPARTNSSTSRSTTYTTLRPPPAKPWPTAATRLFQPTRWTRRSPGFRCPGPARAS
jgi:hypothetical protein